MKLKLYTLIAFVLFTCFIKAQPICDQNGNVAIYSCYDGGDITINVDQNIPNLSIGICSYEFIRVHITGTFAANVSNVWIAGYNGNNNHCNLQTPHTNTITGVANSVDSILLYPPVTLNDPNGYTSIICATGCSNGNQGGCNTTNQLVHYFVTKFGGTMRYHQTQYGCYSGTYNVSAGGNCCLSPFTTSLTEEQTNGFDFELFPNPAQTFLQIKSGVSKSQTIFLINALGETMQTISTNNSLTNVDISTLNAGIYFIKIETEDGVTAKKFIKN